METAPSASKEFPEAPPVKGRVYVSPSPFDMNIVVMSEETWIDFGTTQESMRQMLSKQDARIKELLADNAEAKTVTADAIARLENIRHVRRNEMRERIEGQVEDLVLPGDRKFKIDSTTNRRK